MPIIYSNIHKNEKEAHILFILLPSENTMTSNSLNLKEKEERRKWSERRKMNGHNNLPNSSTYVFCKFQLLKHRLAVC